MNTKRFTPFKISASGKLIFLPLILLVFIWLFQMFYNQLKEKTIDDFNHELMVFAQTASQGITDAFDDYHSDLGFISSIDHINNLDDTGKKMMKAYFENHGGHMAAITRMDEQGKILYTWPENNLAVGQSIAHQNHVKELIKTREPVISDVFMAEQGFSTIAVHTPVFDGDSFRGSIAVLIPIDYLGKKYLKNIKFGGNEKAWLLSENNIEIYCPIHGHTGKPFAENTADEPSTRLLLEKILNDSVGSGSSVHIDQPPDQESAPEERHIVFYRIPLNHTFWTILISYGDQDVYAELNWFRTRLIIILTIAFILMAFYFYTLVRARNIIKEEKKRKKAELSLRESESRFRTVFNQSPIGIELYNSDGLQVDANEAALQMFGIPDISEVKHFNLFEGTSMTRERITRLRRGEVIRYQAVFDFQRVKNLGQYKTHKSGTADFDYIINPLSSDEGKIIGYLVMVQDITKRKRDEKELIEARERAEESEMKVRSMFENTHTGILFCTPQGKILEANPAILEIVGSPSLEESLKVNLLEFEPLRRVGFSQDIEKCLEQKQVVTGKMHYTSRYGKSTFAKYYLIPIYIKNRPVGVWANINDLTDLWQTQQDLKLAKERAEESDRLKSAFLANMSHEIRTPMNGILGFSELLKETDITPEEKIRFIGIIQKSGQRMLNIINDLIDISKIESGQMELNMKETNIPDQAEYLYTFFKPEADKKGLKLIRNFPDKDTPATIITDREKVYAVLTNLLKNAIKYTRRGSIQFGYRHYRNDAGEPFIQFFVKDTGIGIPGDRLKAIFDRFVQADIEDRQAMEGAGLGLAISKAYAEMLGGNISVESEEGKGSTFYFTIAAAHETAPAKKEPAAGEPEKPDTSKKLKVLIAEDDENSQLHLSVILKSISRETLVVENGKDVIETVRNHPDLDLVLMDIKLPGLDGYSATREIRKFNQDIIIIAQTAYALSGDREKALEAGCDDYIPKPIDTAKLLKLISRHLIHTPGA